MSAYDEHFFSIHDAGSLRSAERILPLVLDRATVKSALDVGCGHGTWTKVLLDLGVDATGVDGDYVDRRALMIPADRFWPVDLADTDALKTTKQVDLVVCMEVAEHLPEDVADPLISYLTASAPLVLFSAAIPRQGGTGHTNEQWQSYWLTRFKDRGFAAYDIIRPMVWEDRRVDTWYSQNTLLYASETAAADLGLTSNDGPTLVDVVHPRLHLYFSDTPPLARVAAQVPGAIRRTDRYRYWSRRILGRLRSG